MKDPLWSAIYEMFQDIETLLTQPERLAVSAGRQAGAAAMPAPRPGRTGTAHAMTAVGLMQSSVPTDDLVGARAAIRSKLDILRANLAAQLTERETFHVLFPIVVTCDELVQSVYSLGSQGHAFAWPPLQKELFQIDNGGEVFYETLDDLLRKPDTLPFIWEVFYFCLGYGFKGRYAENLGNINQYKAKLEAKIPVPKFESPQEHAVVSLAAGERLPIWSYVAAVAAIVATYGLLSLLANG